MKLQKAKLLDGRVAWMVLNDNYLPIEPIQKYLRYLDNLSRSPNTIVSYARDLKLYWEFLEISQLDWHEVTIENLADFIHWLKKPDDGVISPQSLVSSRSEKTINRALSCICGFYEFHIHRGSVGKDKQFTRYNMTTGVRQFKSFLSGIAKTKPGKKSLLKLTEPRKFPGCLTQNQVKSLINACNTKRDKLIIKVLYETGMRKGELLGLRIEDMGDCGTNEIAIVARNNINGARVKNGASRVLDVSKELIQVYEDYLIDEYPDIEPDYVFVNIWGGKRGEPLNYRLINQILKQLEKKTGVYVYPHLFRHTHATELIKAGLDIYRVSKRLGHSNISTTLNVYGHLTKEDLRTVVEREEQNNNHS